jgi:hypothetical protein
LMWWNWKKIFIWLSSSIGSQNICQIWFLSDELVSIRCISDITGWAKIWILWYWVRDEIVVEKNYWKPIEIIWLSLCRVYDVSCKDEEQGSIVILNDCLDLSTSLWSTKPSKKSKSTSISKSPYFALFPNFLSNIFSEVFLIINLYFQAILFLVWT